MECLARFAFRSIDFVSLTVRLLQRAPDGPCARRKTETKTGRGQPATGRELVIEPPAAKQPDDHAERELETDGPVASDALPVLLHSCRDGGPTLSMPGAPVKPRSTAGRISGAMFAAMRLPHFGFVVAGAVMARPAVAQSTEETPGQTPPEDEFYLDNEPRPAPQAPPAGPPAPAQPQPSPPVGPPPGSPGHGPAPVFEPVPPGGPPGYGPPIVYEPPPPPKPRHTAPKTALWAGARLGWFFPQSNLWAEQSSDPRFFLGRGWREYASSGPSFELNVGARLGRNYNLFALWERGQLGDGDSFETGLHGGQTGGDTDFWAVALRANSNPDRVGLAVEVALGYRRFRATWADGTELRFTNAPFEARIGIGAEIRLNELVTLSPMLTLGAGVFGNVERLAVQYDDDGNLVGTDIFEEPTFDARAAHHWIGLGVGGHVDLFGR